MVAGISILEAPQLEEQSHDSEDSHACCPCFPPLSICGRYKDGAIILGDATPDNTCPDCWEILRSGWQCARCGQWYRQ